MFDGSLVRVLFVKFDFETFTSSHYLQGLGWTKYLRTSFTFTTQLSFYHPSGEDPPTE
jgi:hypothetical protein